jgi:SAM-dependent methyltransferase
MYGNKIYTKRFYNNQKKNPHSASLILPYIFDTLQIQPKSIVDFGCATGAWLGEAAKLGVRHLKGIEGDWVRKGDLVCNSIDLIHADVGTIINLDTKYDMALCLEVAEHIPQQCADVIIDNLLRASDIILFSAAIENQGGACHVNEQPQSNWINKFREQNYTCHDIIRPHFWSHQNVNVSYRQNAFIFTNRTFKLHTDVMRPIYDIVHPEVFARQLTVSRAMLFASNIRTAIRNKMLKSRYE